MNTDFPNWLGPRNLRKRTRMTIATITFWLLIVAYIISNKP